MQLSEKYGIGVLNFSKGLNSAGVRDSFLNILINTIQLKKLDIVNSSKMSVNISNTRVGNY